MRKRNRALLEKYGTANWKTWDKPIREYETEMIAYRTMRKEFQEITADLEVRQILLQNKRESLCGFENPDKLLDYWESVRDRWIGYHNTQREMLRAESNYGMIKSMIRQAEQPAMPDTLCYSEEQTAKLLSEQTQEQQRLQREQRHLP